MNISFLGIYVSGIVKHLELVVDLGTHIVCLNCQGLVGKSTLYQMNCEQVCVLNHNIVLGEQFEK